MGVGLVLGPGLFGLMGAAGTVLPLVMGMALCCLGITVTLFVLPESCRYDITTER